MKRLAIFHHQPECSIECYNGMFRALSTSYNIKLFTVRDDLDEVLNDVDGIVFPGGIGDSDSYFDFFTRRKANTIASFISRGGRYVGICMGAYWAGSRYFDLLDGLDAVQYIKRPTAEIRRSYGTVADIEWLGQKEKMFFYDGCTFTGSGHYDTIAKYANDEPMAIIQGNIGIIGCHPESEEFWYETPYQYINSYWHKGEHHKLLLEFVDKLCAHSK
jgi:glutamine amidotransferase-like uncharacterized protein